MDHRKTGSHSGASSLSSRMGWVRVFRLWCDPANSFDNKPVVLKLRLYGASQSSINRTLPTHGAEGVKTANICSLCVVPVSFSPQPEEERSVRLSVWLFVVCLYMRTLPRVVHAIPSWLNLN